MHPVPSIDAERAGGVDVVGSRHRREILGAGSLLLNRLAQSRQRLFPDIDQHVELPQHVGAFLVQGLGGGETPPVLVFGHFGHFGLFLLGLTLELVLRVRQVICKVVADAVPSITVFRPQFCHVELLVQGVALPLETLDLTFCGVF